MAFAQWTLSISAFPCGLYTRGHTKPTLSWLKTWKWKIFVSDDWGFIVTFHRLRERDLSGNPSEVLVSGFSCKLSRDLLRFQAWLCLLVTGWRYCWGPNVSENLGTFSKLSLLEAHSYVFQKAVWGQEDGSAGKGTCSQTWHSVFSLYDPYS